MVKETLSRRLPGGASFPPSLLTRCIVLLAVVAANLLAVPSARSDVESVLPDFYSEPDVGAFRKGDATGGTEVIDPLSGTLTLKYVDLSLPGNGGMDINIVRTYTSQILLTRKTATNIAPYPGPLLPTGPVGVGWTINFGRVVKSDDGGLGICDTGDSNPDDDTRNNPVLELPGGRQEILVSHNIGVADRYTFSTKDLWGADCIGDGLLVYSTDGTKYTFDHHVISLDEVTYTTRVNNAWYPTRIEDRNGNYLTFTYYPEQKGSHALIQQITASDGRVVDFTYTDRASGNARLTSISANGQTWHYEYTQIQSSGNYQLTRVVRPDGLSWDYTYNDYSASPGDYALQQVTHPYGGTVSYTYDYVDFTRRVGLTPWEFFYSVVVASKTIGGRENTPATWTYAYAPGGSEDVTTITFPGGKHVYRHFGIDTVISNYVVGYEANLWKVGLLAQKQIYDVDGAGVETLVQQEDYSRSTSYVDSDEDYYRPPYKDSLGNDIKDFYVHIPELDEKTIIRDGTTYRTQYSAYNLNGQPEKVMETGQVGTAQEMVRSKDLTWYPVTRDQNIDNLIEAEVLEGEVVGKNIYRMFDYNNGNLLSLNRHGVTETYTYHPTGDLATKTNARGKVWTYDDYYRGLPRQTLAPEGVETDFTVNDTGTVADATNGRRFVTAYQYDDLNRPVLIDHPQGSDVTVTWDATSRTITRGTYTQVTTFDGFGRPICVDTSGIYKKFEYDYRGNVIFESYPSTNPCSLLTQGTTTTYDVLNRVTRVDHPDGTFTQTEYLPGNQVRVTNERGLVTTYTYRSFGDPDNKDDTVLMRVDAPEGISTVYTRNILGQVESITQGGATRSYSYDPDNNFLISRTDPETGAMAFGRDEVGNMTSRQVGSSPVTIFTYDGLDRLTSVDYPGTTPDITREYDANGNLTRLAAGISDKAYTYDANDNLTAEAQQIDGKTFDIGYAYTGLDYLDTITYPSGRTVTYAPDSLGRPTEAMPFLASTTFHPSGPPNQILYANGAQTDITLTSRLWTDRILTSHSGSVVDLTYGYDGAGNVTGITDGIDLSSNRSLGYDGVNRLTSANGVWGTGTISYDATGNILSKSIGGDSLSYTYDAITDRLTGVSGARNDSYSYDVYGNVTGNGRDTMTYDDASNLRTISGSASITYEYDGDGKRVRRVKNGTGLNYIYARNGNLLAEQDDTGYKYKDYVYLGTRLMAVADVDNDTDNDTLADDWEIQYFGDLSWGANDDPDGDGITNAQELAEGTDPSTAQLPTTVQGLTATPGDTQVSLTWDASIGAARYNVYWSTSPGVTKANGSKIADVSSPYVHTGLTNDTTYYYVVTAENTAGETAESNEAWAIPGIPQWSDAFLLEYDDQISAGTPDVAMDNHGNGIAVRSQSGVWMNYYQSGTGWQGPAPLDPSGGGSEPSVAMSTDGRILAVWAGSTGEVWARWYDPDAGWAAPTLVASLNGTISTPRASIDASGNGIVLFTNEAWAGTQDTLAAYAVRYDVTNGWQTPVLITSETQPSGVDYADYRITELVGTSFGEAFGLMTTIVQAPGYDPSYSLTALSYDPLAGWQTYNLDNTGGSVYANQAYPDADLAVDDSDDAMVVWTAQASGDPRQVIRAQRYDGVSRAWEAGSVIIDNDTTSSTGPRIGLDEQGNALVVWSQSDGSATRIWSNRYEYGVGWSTPQLAEGINQGNANFASLVVKGNGQARVAWVDWDGPNRSLYSNDYDPTTGWATAEQIYGPVPNDLVDLKLAMNDGKESLAAWRQDGGGRWDLLGKSFAMPIPNAAPIANAGADTAVYEGEAAALDGSASVDPDGTIAAYAWTRTAGPLVILNGATTATPDFTAPQVTADTVLTFKLTVTDADGATDTDTVDVTVKESDSDSDGLDDRWELQYFGDLTQGANDDPDGDGLTNLQEQTAGTDPNVPDPPPTPVTGLVAVPGDGEAIVSWLNAPGANSYNVYWDTSPGVTPGASNVISNVMTPQWHQGLSNGTTYYYVVTAVNVQGESDPSVEVSATPAARQWGNAIYTDASNDPADSPAVATDGSGNAIVVWRQDDGTGTFDIRARRYSALSGWEQAVTLDTQSGDANAPRIAMDAIGDAIVVWTQNDGVRDNLWSSRYDRNASTWQPAGLLETIDTTYGVDSNAEAPQIAMAPNGTAAVSWTQEIAQIWPGTSQGVLAPIVYTRIYLPGQGWQGYMWEARNDVGASSNPRIAVDDAGEAALTWERYTIPEGGGFRINQIDVYVDRYDPASGWAGPMVIDTNTGTTTSDDADQPDIGIDNAGNAIVIWRQEGRNYSIWRARFDAATGTWDTPTELPTQGKSDGSDPVVAVNPAGQCITAWLESGTIKGQAYDPASGWQSITGLGDGGMPDLGIDAEGNALVAWSEGTGIGLSRYTGAGGWSSEPVMSAVAGGLQGPVEVAMDAYGGAFIGWQETDASAGTSVFVRRFAVFQGGSVNSPPTADGGGNQTVDEGAPVTLDGSKSFDLDGAIATYDWLQTGGQSVSLSGASTAVATFTAPVVTSNTTLTFSLTVTDTQSATDVASVTITVANVDSDDDGLPDAWELQYFGNLTQGPTDDPDGDGATNAEEWQEGTDPTVADPPPAMVTGLAAEGGNAQVTLTWPDVPQATSYNVYWSLSPGVTKSNGTLIAGATSPYVHSGLTNGVPVYYVVTAVNAFGESAESAEVTATPAVVREWSNLTVIDSSGLLTYYLALAIDESGTADVIGEEPNGTSYPARLRTSRYEAGTGWSSPVLLVDDSGGVSDPDVARAGGTSVVAWELARKNGNNEVWADVDTGSGWPGGARISTRGVRSTRVQLAAAPNGNALAIWDTNQFQASRYVQGVGWDADPTVLSTNPSSFNITVPVRRTRALVADGAENWTVVWSESGSGLWSRRRDAVSGWQASRLLLADAYPWISRCVRMGRVWRYGTKPRRMEISSSGQRILTLRPAWWISVRLGRR